MMETGWLPTKDGKRLFFRWADVDEPRAALLFVHGLGEHSGRYEHVFRAMNARGYACLGYDYRGHGKAEGRRAHVDRFGEFVDDLEAARALLRARRPDAPLFLVGHSMGGLIVVTWLLDHQGSCRGAVLSSPGLGVAVAVPAWKDALARLMSRAWPTLSMPSGIEPAMVSRDPETVEAYATDPLIGRKVTARWYIEFLGAQERALAEAGRIHAPVLVMPATEDKLVDPAATRVFFERLGSEDKTLAPWEGLYHEIFNEPEREQVFEAVDAWLRARL